MPFDPAERFPQQGRIKHHGCIVLFVYEIMPFCGAEKIASPIRVVNSVASNTTSIIYLNIMSVILGDSYNFLELISTLIFFSCSLRRPMM